MKILSAQIDESMSEVIVVLLFEQKAVGETMTLSLSRGVKVHNRKSVMIRELDKRKALYEEDIHVSYAGEVTRKIPLYDFKEYDYQGVDISIFTEVQLSKKDSMLRFFTKQKQRVNLDIYTLLPDNIESNELLINPVDGYDFFKNIKALSNKKQTAFIVFFVASIAIIIGNTLIGLHDQLSPKGEHYLYSHSVEGAPPYKPITYMIIVNTVLLAFFTPLWKFRKKLLARYMGFQITRELGSVSKGRRYKLRDLLSGQSLVDLKNCELHIIACNVERGEYETGHKNKKIVQLETPIKCVSIYKKQFDYIPKNMEINNFLNDDICFDEVYEQLIPESMVSKTHGMKLHWEVQFIHPELVDQELIGSSEGFIIDNFKIMKETKITKIKGVEAA